MSEYKVIPKNEMQTREWLTAHLADFGIDVLKTQTAFPDFLILWNEREIKAEIEYESANFIVHKHNPCDCDIVICWRHTANIPVPVLELMTGKTHKVNSGAIPFYENKKPNRFNLSWLDNCGDEIFEFMNAYSDEFELYLNYREALVPVHKHFLDVGRRLEEALSKYGGGKFMERIEWQKNPLKFFLAWGTALKSKHSEVKI